MKELLLAHKRAVSFRYDIATVLVNAKQAISSITESTRKW